MQRTRSRSRLHLIALAGLALLVAACTEPEPPEPLGLHSSHGGPDGVTGVAGDAAGAGAPQLQRWLGGLRGATARFHDFDAAVKAGYSVKITECMEEPGVGGMGYHYGNPLLIDGTVEEFAPEVLLYERQRNGRMRLVGLEFLVPFDDWTQPDRPVLHGLRFHPNHAFQVWALHVWLWEHNPAGMFQDWNPRINCKYAR